MSKTSLTSAIPTPQKQGTTSTPSNILPPPPPPPPPPPLLLLRHQRHQRPAQAVLKHSLQPSPPHHHHVRRYRSVHIPNVVRELLRAPRDDRTRVVTRGAQLSGQIGKRGRGRRGREYGDRRRVLERRRRGGHGVTTSHEGAEGEGGWEERTDTCEHCFFSFSLTTHTPHTTPLRGGGNTGRGDENDGGDERAVESWTEDKIGRGEDEYRKQGEIPFSVGR